MEHLNQNRFRELIEAQLGNLIVTLAEKTVQIETITAENTALKAEIDKLKAHNGPVQ